MHIAAPEKYKAELPLTGQSQITGFAPDAQFAAVACDCEAKKYMSEIQ